MEFSNKPFFINVTNKFTGLFHNEFLLNAIDTDNAVQIVISTRSIDPLNYNIQVDEASSEQAKKWLEEEFPNGDKKHIVIDGDLQIAELIYNPMGNPYG